MIGANCEKEKIAISLNFPFLYGNDECIYNVSRLDLHFLLRMVS